MTCFPAELYLVLDKVSEAEACVMETSSMFPLSHQVYFMVGLTWRPVCLWTCSFGHIMSLWCMFCHLCHVMLLPAAFFLPLPCLALFLVRYIRSCLVAGVAPSFYDVLFKNLVPLRYWVTSWNTSTVLFPVMHLVFMIRFSLFSVISSHFMIHFPCFLSSPITSTCIFLVSCLLKSVHHAFFLFPVFSSQFMMHFSCFLSSPITSSCIFLVSCLLKSVHDAFSLFPVSSSQFMMHFPCFLSSQVSSWCIFLVSCHLKSLYDVFSLCYLQLWCFKSFSFFLLLFVCGVFVTYVCVWGGVVYVCVCVCVYVCVCFGESEWYQNIAMYCSGFASVRFVFAVTTVKTWSAASMLVGVHQLLFPVCSEGECLNTNSSSWRPEYAMRMPLPSTLATQRVCITW